MSLSGRETYALELFCKLCVGYDIEGKGVTSTYPGSLEQVSKLSSSPLHSTSSNHTVPLPGPKCDSLCAEVALLKCK